MPFPSGHTPLGVIFGAGSVGRGFIGEILLDAGWAVTFIDASPRLVEALNTGSYPHDTVATSGVQRKVLTGYTTFSAQDTQEVTSAVISTDVIFTSVGSANLSHVAAALAPGLIARTSVGHPVDVFLAENLHSAATVMLGLLESELQRLQVPDPSRTLENVGLVETSIGRMIPVPTTEQERQHPALVAVESHRQLPFDKAACRAPVPDVPELLGREDVDFSFYADRKLYVHNQGHSLTAYLGALAGEDEIAPSIANDRVARVVRAAMYATARALAAKYEQPLPDLLEHADDLLQRFANTALHDTVARVGRDPARKLAPDDRFLGALSLTTGWGEPSAVMPGIALAAHQLALSRPRETRKAAVAQVRGDVSRISPAMVGLFDDLVAALLADMGLEDFLDLVDARRAV